MPRMLDRGETIDTYQHSRRGVPSAWYGHVPFGHWLTASTRPRTIVELGTHNGVSFSSFCDAVVTGEMNTVCYAVDTWQGDFQAGVYGEEVWTDWSIFNEKHFGRFARLLRGTFDEALDEVADASVDLLHIDGLHTYEAVKHDFDAWLPKLSERGVVIMHDIAERQKDFGVWQVWAELQKSYPTFEFLHEHGLGVVAVGGDVPDAVKLLVTADAGETVEWRARFAAAGERVKLDEANAQLHKDLTRLTVGREQLDRDIDELRKSLAELNGQVERLDSEVQARDLRIDELLDSTSWKVTRPIRGASRVLAGIARRSRSR